MKKTLLVFVLLCTYTMTWGQEKPNAEFAKFAQEKSTQVRSAYDHKDPKAGEKAMKELVAKYNTLSEKDKAAYKRNISYTYYDLACMYAIMNDKQHAVDNLERSELYDYSLLMRDEDLANIRKYPGFIKYLAKARAINPDNMAKLQDAPAYGTQSSAGIPAFTYQPANEEHLALLRKTYNLDSIAGQGTDVSQMINLMRWVHNLVPHDGSKGNPAVKNAMDLITTCQREHKTLNCRGLAILLNEVYLAEGFESRYITCMPKDTADQDCHVITMVYSLKQNKWIWMDPTFNAYIMDENGNLLGPDEVRERLIKNKPLILNPDADHNHENSETKEYYLGDYMAKNLYKLVCAVSSEYNYETAGTNKTRAYITLIPGSKIPEQRAAKNEHDVDSYTSYYTTNPNLFWQLPQKEALVNYEKAMSAYQQYYNTHNADGIRDMFSDVWKDYKPKLYTPEEQKQQEDKYGSRLISYKYIGSDEDGTQLYKVVYEKSTHAMGISLDREGKFLNFRPKTSSSHINALLAKN